VESRLLGFPYSVISMAFFGNAFHKVTITAKARFGNRNHLSKMPTFSSKSKVHHWRSVNAKRFEVEFLGVAPWGIQIVLEEGVVPVLIRPKS